MTQKDPNVLAKEIYDNPELADRYITADHKVVLSSTGSYHNNSVRGQKGLSGEDTACEYLLKKGYRILCRNFRCYSGEIDIIASIDGKLVFVEVKTRSSTIYGRPRDSVTVSKQRKIRRCAETYLAIKGLRNNIPPLSFDVIEIIGNRNRILTLEHLQNCF